MKNIWIWPLIIAIGHALTLMLSYFFSLSFDVIDGEELSLSENIFTTIVSVLQWPGSAIQNFFKFNDSGEWTLFIINSAAWGIMISLGIKYFFKLLLRRKS